MKWSRKAGAPAVSPVWVFKDDSTDFLLFLRASRPVPVYARLVTDQYARGEVKSSRPGGKARGARWYVDALALTDLACLHRLIPHLGLAAQLFDVRTECDST